MRELLRYAITCLSFSLAVQAQEPDAIFARYDRDKDGKVTAAELPNKAAFARYDLDKDGAITVAEYAKGSSSAATRHCGSTPYTMVALSRPIRELAPPVRTSPQSGAGAFPCGLRPCGMSALSTSARGF